MTQKTKAKGNGEGSVFKAGNKYRWMLTLGYDSEGNRSSKSGYEATKKAANEALTQAKADRDRGLLAVPDHVTMAEYVERWLGYQHDITPRTVHKYKQELSYVLEHLGSMPVQDVRSQHVKQLILRLSTRTMQHRQPMSRSTLGRTLTRLRALFREAVSDQIIYANPIVGVKLPKKVLANEAAATQALSPPQAARLHAIGATLYDMDLCRLWPALFLALGMGLRRGEVLGLKWSDVDLARGLLRVRQTRVMDVIGITTGNPKTTNSRRELHMPDSVVTLLRRHAEAQAAERVLAGRSWDDGDIVFATALGHWTHPDNLNRAIRAVLKWSDPVRASKTEGKSSIWQRVPRDRRAGLKELILSGEVLPHISPHDLRHTYATLALRNKVPVEVVSKNLGHASPMITLTIYRHVLDDELRATVIDLFPTLPMLPARQVVALN